MVTPTVQILTQRASRHDSQPIQLFWTLLQPPQWFASTSPRSTMCVGSTCTLGIGVLIAAVLPRNEAILIPDLGGEAYIG